MKQLVITRPEPTVTVIMPVYNGGRFLSLAIESILKQSFLDYELIIINDGSSDNTPDILESFRLKDERINILTFSQNRGLVAALNKGLELSRGKYIARMDQDDISLSERLRKQVEFLKEHTEVGILGCDLMSIDQNGRELGILQYPSDDYSIRWQSLFENPFAHPAIMFRKDVLLQHGLAYNPYYDKIEDYPLWLQVLEHTVGANLPDVLVHYRIHRQSITSLHKEREYHLLFQIIRNNLFRLMPFLTIYPGDIESILSCKRGEMKSNLRAQAAAFYLRTWFAFQMLRLKSDKAHSLEKQVVIVALKLSLYPFFQTGSFDNLKTISKLRPDWFFVLLGELPKLISLRIVSTRIRAIKTEHIEDKNY